MKSDSYLRVVEQACERRGLRLTPLRAQVLRLVLEAGQPIKAYEVLAGITSANGETAPMTAYRPLNFLAAHGFIHRLASLSSYVACTHPGNQRPEPFLICEKCHAVLQANGKHIVSLLHSLARDHGFLPRAQSLEVLGECAVCVNNRAGSPAATSSRDLE